MSAVTWSTVTWTVARAGGMTAYVLLTLSVVLGLSLSLRWQSPRWPRLITNEVHSFLTVLSLAFIAVHGLAVWIDPFMRFGWAEVFVPFLSHYRPVWMALGIVAGYLCLAVWISTQVRPRIGYAWWRRLHTLAFAVYVLSTVHGIATGSDTRTPWALGLYAGSVLLVGALLELRLLKPSGTRHIGTRRIGHPRLAALSAGTIVVGALWTAAGPVRAGWNAVANNGQGTGARSVAAAPSAQQTTLAPSAFTASLHGSLTQGNAAADGTVTLRVDARLNDGTQRSLGIMIQGQPGDDGSLTVTRTRVSLGAHGNSPAYQGPLTALQGDSTWHMTALLSSAGAPTNQLQVQIDVQSSGDGQVSGVIQGMPLARGAAGQT